MTSQFNWLHSSWSLEAVASFTHWLTGSRCCRFDKRRMTVWCFGVLFPCRSAKTNISSPLRFVWIVRRPACRTSKSSHPHWSLHKHSSIWSLGAEVRFGDSRVKQVTGATTVQQDGSGNATVLFVDQLRSFVSKICRNNADMGMSSKCLNWAVSHHVSSLSLHLQWPFLIWTRLNRATGPQTSHLHRHHQTLPLNPPFI